MYGKWQSFGHYAESIKKLKKNQIVKYLHPRKILNAYHEIHKLDIKFFEETRSQSGGYPDCVLKNIGNFKKEGGFPIIEIEDAEDPEYN